jgi:hypothetical protein
MVMIRSEFKGMTGYTRDWLIAKERVTFKHNPVTIKRKSKKRERSERESKIKKKNKIDD